MLIMCFFLCSLCTEWKDAMDLSKQATANGALERAPADGSVTAHIQVIIIVFKHLVFECFLLSVNSMVYCLEACFSILVEAVRK